MKWLAVHIHRLVLNGHRKEGLARHRRQFSDRGSVAFYRARHDHSTSKHPQQRSVAVCQVHVGHGAKPQSVGVPTACGIARGIEL